MPPQGTDMYDTEWVYLSMYSESGCTLHLTLLFKDDQGHQTRKRNKGPKETIDID